MITKRSVIQQDYDDLMQHIESIYQKEQIDKMCEYADQGNQAKEELEVITISNSSVYGY